MGKIEIVAVNFIGICFVASRLHRGGPASEESISVTLEAVI
jgi:hypothetical protein